MVAPCRVWVLELVFCPFYYQSLAHGSERSQNQKTIFIVLIKSFTVNEYVLIAIEKQPIVLALQQAMYCCMYLGIRYAICYGIPIIVKMPIFFTVPFTGTIVLLNQIIPSKYNELRLDKATSLSQYRNKGVGKRNKP